MLNLSQEQKVLFSLLRGETVEDTAADWDAVRREAQEQAVFLLVAHAKGLPESRKKLWRRETFETASDNLYAYHAAEETARLMEQHGFPYVILKGLSSASCYPVWFDRMLGDVDFLIDPAQRADVEAALEEAGYENQDAGHSFHVAFGKEKQHLEMHFDLPGIPDGKAGEPIRAYLAGVLAERIPLKIKGRTFPVPTPRHHGLILLLHMQNHMVSSGIGLRHLMDWCCFVSRTGQEPFWEKELLPLLKRVGLFHYAKVMTQTGVLYLGTEHPDWCTGIPESLCDAVMEDILIGGNFGQKDKVRSASGIMIHGKGGVLHGKVYSLYFTMLRYIRDHHPNASRYWVLYPFFFAESALQWCRMVRRGQKVSLLTSAKYVQERKAVYDQLHIFEVPESQHA